MTEKKVWDVDALAKILLTEQEEPEDLPIPTVEHWTSILERRIPLSVQDKALLAISPISRSRHAFAQHRFRNNYFRTAANSNNIPILPAAASSVKRERVRFMDMPDFTVMIEPSGPNGWYIICDVSERVPIGSRVELVDHKGTVWLSGFPNEDDRIITRYEGVSNPLDDRGPFVIRVDGFVLT